MHFFRHNMIRRFTLLILLSWGLLTQVATVYACDSEGGKKQIGCCCDTAGKMDCKTNSDSVTHNSSNNTAGACCDISYGVSDTSMLSSNSASTTLQVLLLDASQPPPILLSHQPDVLFQIVSLTIPQLSTPPTTGTHIYLHTQRLRI